MLKFRLEEVLWQKKLRLIDVSRMSGIQYSTLHKLCTGKTRGISFRTLEALCSSLQCQPADFFLYIPKKQYGKREREKSQSNDKFTSEV